MHKAVPRGRSFAVLCLALALAGLVVACGRAPADFNSSTASAARTPSPAPSPSPSMPTYAAPDPTLLTASNCSGVPASTSPQLLGNYYTVRPAASWTKTGDYQHTETLLLELTAPQSYGSAPTRIQFHSDLGAVHLGYGAGATAHSIAQKRADSIVQETSVHF